MQNVGIRFADDFLIVRKAHTFILHFAF